MSQRAGQDHRSCLYLDISPELRSMYFGKADVLFFKNHTRTITPTFSPFKIGVSHIRFNRIIVLT